jgi:hypothetical protein
LRFWSVEAPVRLLSSLLALGLVAALSAGCSSDAAPVPAPRPSSSQVTKTPADSPTASSTPTEQPPAMPAAAKGKGRPAAKAFVRYYIDLINYAGTTGDVADMQRVSQPGCVSCRRLIELFSRTYDRGGYFHTRGWRVNNIFVAESAQPGVWIAATEVRTSKVRWKTASASPEKSVSGEVIAYRIEIQSKNRHWLVKELTRT